MGTYTSIGNSSPYLGLCWPEFRALSLVAGHACSKIGRVFPKFRKAGCMRAAYTSLADSKLVEPRSNKSKRERIDMMINDVSTDKLVTDLKRVARDSEELLKAMGEVSCSRPLWQRWEQ